MKKLFLFIAAALVSTGMWATQTLVVSNTTELSETFADGTVLYSINSDGAAASSTAFKNADIIVDGVKKSGPALSAQRFAIKFPESVSAVTIYGYNSSSGRSISKVYTSATMLKSSYTEITSSTTKSVSSTTPNYSYTFTASWASPIAANTYIRFDFNNACNFYKIVYTPSTKYTVTYDLDGGLYDGSSTAPTQAAVISGTSITLPALTPTKEGFNFLGWTCSVDATDYAAGDAYTMTAANTTFTAHWVSTSAATHTISYTETKGADNSANPTEYTEGVGIASFEPLADVTDFHFTGWSPASISSSATTDQTIEAQWVDAYNVTFSAGEGTGSIPSSFQKWATATFELPGQGEMVAPDGKAFDGWKDQDAASFAEGDTYTMPAKAVTLTAQWVDIYMVTFNLQEHGEAIDKQDIVSGRKATKPADPFAVGYIFDGWYKEEACTNEWDFENDVVTEDTELFAKWTSFTVNATIIFATSGAAPTAKNDAALLAEGSNGGVVTFVGAKDDKYNESFAYTSSGLALQKGGADSVKVVLNSTLQAGSYIQLDMTSANSGARGLKIQKGKDSNVYNASWTASAAGEHNIITYKVTSSDGLAGKNTFWLARNNTVYLKQIIIGNWYVEPTAIDNAEDGVKAQKFVENGQLYIQKDGKIYNVMGMEIR